MISVNNTNDSFLKKKTITTTKTQKTTRTLNPLSLMSHADVPGAALAVTALEATSSFKEAQATPSIWLREILRCCDC